MVAALVTFALTSCTDDPVLPVADFSYAPADITVWDVVTFTNSTKEATTYAWDFGDGSTSSDENPTHVYTAAGDFTVTLKATNADGENEATQTITIGKHENYYMLGSDKFVVDSSLFWYASSQGGDPYIRLLTPVTGQDNPDLLKIFVNKGLHDLPGTYTWMSTSMMGSSPDVDQYDMGYTANYAGMSYDYTTDGNTAGNDLVVTELADGVYQIEGQVTLNTGNWNFATMEFESLGEVTLQLHYIGDITPL